MRETAFCIIPNNITEFDLEWCVSEAREETTFQRKIFYRHCIRVEKTVERAINGASVGSREQKGGRRIGYNKNGICVKRKKCQ